MTNLSAFTESLVAARRSGLVFTPEGAVPDGTAQAYRVQAAVAEAFGETGAFKVALQGSSPAIFAPIRADLCLPSGAEVARQSVGVELEVGWLITAPLPEPGAPEFQARLIEAVSPVPVIELLERRMAGPHAAAPMVKLADGLLNWGLVVGTPLDAWDGSDFGRLSGSMRAGGTVLLDGMTAVPGGSALATLEAFLAAVGGQGTGIRPGQVVITGTLHPMTFIEADADIRGMIDGLGEVGFSLRGVQSGSHG